MTILKRISRIVMKQISCYLKGKIDFGLCFKGGIEDIIMSQMHFEQVVYHSQDSKMNIMGRNVLNDLFTISKELMKTLWACCIPKGLFAKAIVLMGTNSIMYKNTQMNMFIVKQITLAILMIIDAHQVMFHIRKWSYYLEQHEIKIYCYVNKS